MRIGADPNDPEGLSQVKGLHVTERGDVWILEASTYDIRVFDSTGRPVRRIGRKGQGPGEFLW
ncbi:MAG: 6-bladed beta-propeller, partial [Gemmatimonadales bacterium]